MKFPGKMGLKIILKVTKKQGFTRSLENTFLEKPQGVQTDPSPPFPSISPSLVTVNVQTLMFEKPYCVTVEIAVLKYSF